MTFLVALIGVLSVQFAALTPVGRRFRDRYVPRWVRPKYAFFVAFGLPWAVAIVLAVLTVIGEGVAFAFADLIALFVVMMVMNATGMVEGRINVMFTTPEPIPDPWLLLSFRDRHKIKKAARRGRLPDDESLMVAAAEWTDAVMGDPTLSSPRQRERADVISRLLSQAGSGRSRPANAAADPDPNAG